jgi:hypothetical protein
MAGKFLFKVALMTMFAGMAVALFGGCSRQTCKKEQTMSKDSKETAKPQQAAAAPKKNGKRSD